MQWTDEGIERSRSQFLYFLYWHESQQRAATASSTAASLTHVWPLFSHWDNGAGRRQWQLLSPFEVFFGNNAPVRQTWSPLFALVRHNQPEPGHTRTSLLWNAVTWERQAAEARTEFHLGPLLGVTSAGTERRIAIGNGLFGFHRPVGGAWHLFWVDFTRRRRPGGENP
jgi:hypothetical protein